MLQFTRASNEMLCTLSTDRRPGIIVELSMSVKRPETVRSNYSALSLRAGVQVLSPNSSAGTAKKEMPLHFRASNLYRI